MVVDALVPSTGTDPTVSAAMAVYARLQAVRNVLAPDLNDQELQLFAMVAQHSRLDPFAKQIYAIKRGGRLTFQTGIDGFRSSAEETGEYRGSDEPEFGAVIERPFPHPEWARVVVHRQYPNGDRLDQAARVDWDEFYPGDSQGAQWKKMPRNQLAKCAEAAAFRKAFPKQFGQVYAREEMDQAETVAVAVQAVPTARERARARVEAVAPVASAPHSPAGPAPSEGEAPDQDAGQSSPSATPVCGEPDPVDDERCVLPHGHPSTIKHEGPRGAKWA